MRVLQKQVARKFVGYWTFPRGNEKGEDQQSWNSLLGEVLDMDDITSRVQHQVPASRPTARTTGTTGVSPVDSTFAYNDRSEILSAAIGTKLFTHAYDDIGNHLLFGDNAVTNTYTHNNLNQITTSLCSPASPRTIHHNADGGLSSDGIWSYAYDAEDQLRSVTSRSLTNGAIRVRNTYDYRRRRISKTVQRLNVTTASPPAPPVELREWETCEERTFVYDDWNLIHETIYTIEGGVTNTSEVQYFWGLDLSGTLQGAGGVGGLLAVSRNGQFYFPSFDNNGNITKYIDESGTIAATHEYDDFGRIISQSGPLADFFRHRFSTKYYDLEVGLYCYGYRFYSPDWRIWLNRDPLEENGGMNLYCFLNNSTVRLVDPLGLVVIVTHTNNEPPPGGWRDSRDTGMVIPTFRIPETMIYTYKNGKVRYRVSFDPTETRIDIYFKYTATLETFKAEREHVDCDLPFDSALDAYKNEVESIYDCPENAEKLFTAAVKKLDDALRQCRQCNKQLDRPGGPHGH